MKTRRRDHGYCLLFTWDLLGFFAFTGVFTGLLFDVQALVRIAFLLLVVQVFTPVAGVILPILNPEPPSPAGRARNLECARLTEYRRQVWDFIAESVPIRPEYVR